MPPTPYTFKPSVFASWSAEPQNAAFLSSHSDPEQLETIKRDFARFNWWAETCALTVPNDSGFPVNIGNEKCIKLINEKNAVPLAADALEEIAGMKGETRKAGLYMHTVITLLGCIACISDETSTEFGKTRPPAYLVKADESLRKVCARIANSIRKLFFEVQASLADPPAGFHVLNPFVKWALLEPYSTYKMTRADHEAIAHLALEVWLKVDATDSGVIPEVRTLSENAHVALQALRPTDPDRRSRARLAAPKWDHFGYTWDRLIKRSVDLARRPSCPPRDRIVPLLLITHFVNFSDPNDTEVNDTIIRHGVVPLVSRLANEARKQGDLDVVYDIVAFFWQTLSWDARISTVERGMEQVANTSLVESTCFWLKERARPGTKYAHVPEVQDFIEWMEATFGAMVIRTDLFIKVVPQVTKCLRLLERDPSTPPRLVAQWRIFEDNLRKESNRNIFKYMRTPRCMAPGCMNAWSTEGDVLLTCATCKGVRYCSRVCQKADWKAHKLNCNKAPA